MEVFLYIYHTQLIPLIGGLENKYATEYASFLKQRPASCSIQALETVEAIVITKEALQYGYEHIKEGNKLGRLLAEHHFMMIADKVLK